MDPWWRACDWHGFHCDGCGLAALEDVMVVVIQYRLGMLGFFRLTQRPRCTPAGQE